MWGWGESGGGGGGAVEGGDSGRDWVNSLKIVFIVIYFIAV